MFVRTCSTLIALSTLALTTLTGCGKEPAATPADGGAATESSAGAETSAPAKDEVAQAIAELPQEEQAAALAQKWCPVSAMNGGDNLLGSMGKPVKVTVDGQDVYLCCEGCTEEAQKDPAATLAKVEELTRKAAEEKQ